MKVSLYSSGEKCYKVMSRLFPILVFYGISKMNAGHTVSLFTIMGETV